MHQVIINSLLIWRHILVCEILLTKNDSYTINILTDSSKLIACRRKQNIMNQMFINDILCMEMLDCSLSKGVTNLCNHLLFCIKIDNAFTGRQFFTLSKHCPFFFWHIQPVCLCDAYKMPAFSLLRCNSRALLVISILFSG